MRSAVVGLAPWVDQQNAVDVGGNVRDRFTHLAKSQGMSNKPWLVSEESVKFVE